MAHQYSQVPQADLDDGTGARPLIAADGLHRTDCDGAAPGLLQIPTEISDLSVEERDFLEAQLKRKIDLRLMPMVILMYIMNYLDRNNIASARIAGPDGKGIEDDLGLSSRQYQISISILFVGYLLMQVPSNLLLNKIGLPAIYLPCCMIVWGMISTATAATHSFWGLLTCRFFLGFVEAAYFPGVLFFLSSWYTRKELALRSAMLYSGSLVSGTLSGLVAAAITNGLDGFLGLRAWRWLFLIEGILTVFVAFAALFILPNFPRTTSWLTPEERALAIWRLEEDVGLDDWVAPKSQSLWHGFDMAIKDPKVFVLAIMLTGIISAASVTNFFPSVVQTLNYGPVATLLLTTPPYAIGVVTLLLNSWHADRTGERFWHIALPLSVGVASFILAAMATSTAGRYCSMLLMVPGVYTSHGVVLAWISNSVPRPPEKRAAALALINAISNASSIWASFLYPESAAPQYGT
jgi:MFS family permease